MAQAGNLQFGVDESFLSQSVSRALINGTKMAQRSNAFTPGINEQAFRQPLGRITGDVSKFQSSLAAANQRVIAFGASASVFYGISTALRSLVTSTIQVNKSMIEINSIFGLSQKNLSSFKNELFDVARKTSQSFNVVAESAKEFSRQGLSVAETLKRVRDSMILTRMTGLSAADAANTLTAAINSFNKSGLNSTEILNKMVAADTNFAVSSKDLADALTRVGSSAQDAGVQFEELLALVTSVKQITGREGSVIANGFKSIFNREQRSTTLEQLEKLGVAVRDQNSNILPTIQVLKNLAKEYDTLGVSQKQQVAQMMGGVYQMNTLKAVMSDLSKENSIYNQALKEIGKSQDEAIKRNEYLNTSFASMIERAQATFGQIGANLGEKIFTSNTGSIKQAINSLFGRENFEGFVKGLEGVDTEGIGNTLGQGLIKGLGNTFGVTNGVPGPGLLAIGLGITRVLTTSVGMAVKDMGSMLNFGQKIQSVNVGIERAILGANEAEKMRLASAKSVAAQEAVILDILIRQNAAMAAMKAERSALQVSVVSNNPILAKEAIKMAKWVPPTAASGLLPAIAQESHSISKGIGGATPSAKPVVIPNFNFGGGQRGPVVANTDEYLVPNYKGAGSAIFNRQMVASQGLPSGAVRVAASGLTPINIENQFGGLFGNLIGRDYHISDIVTSKKGLGYSNKLYKELFDLLGERGARSVVGQLVPQDMFSNPKIKGILPQLGRGKFGKSNILRLFDENDNFGPSINLKGGNLFDNDLELNSKRIRQFMQQGYGATEFTSFLAGGHIPNFANIDFIPRKEREAIFSALREKLNPQTIALGGGKTMSGNPMQFVPRAVRINGEDYLLHYRAATDKDRLKYSHSYLSDDKKTGTKYDLLNRSHVDSAMYNTIGTTTSQKILQSFYNYGYRPYIGKYLTKISDIENRFKNGLIGFPVGKSASFQNFGQFEGEREISQLNGDNLVSIKKFLVKRGENGPMIPMGRDSVSLFNGYIPNFARRGRPSIKGRQIRYEGDMDFSSVLGPKGLLNLFTIFGFGLGNHPTKSTIDRRTLEKFGISIPDGLTPGSKFPYRGAAGGLIPNFANKFYRGVGRFKNDSFKDPFTLSDSKKALFASRDLEEAQSYGFNIGEFSLKKGLKGLNLYSESGLSILEQLYEKVEKKSHYLLPRRNSTEKDRRFFKSTRGVALFNILDKSYINDELRNMGYDFVSFPDMGNIGTKGGRYETNKNISILNPNALINKQLLNASKGLLPKSLSNAISREIKAGAPLSSIYLDKDSRLISRDNPMGLLVANRRDEPAGGFEGVNRYQNMGLNPKTAGSHIPNFADPSEMLYKYFEKFQLSGGNAASILGPKALPSLGNAEKLIGQQIAKVIKNVDLKSVDFTSGNFTSQITKKVKDSIQTSFKGIDFGHTSAFSKITDQIIQDREREIKSLIKYQSAVKLSNIENEKRAKFESFVSSKIQGTKTQSLSKNELVRNAADLQTTQNIEFSGSKLATQINKQTSIQNETLAAIKRQAAANTIQSKLSSGKMFGDLTGLEQITLRKQFQQQAYQQLGFAGSGASLMSVMGNKEARGQISDYVNQQIGLISQKEQLPQISGWQKWKARASSPMGQMAMMMAPSMLSGFIPEGEGGTAKGMALGGAQTALVGMGTGAMFGPIGAAVGAGVGGFMGIASKWNKSFDEISREIEKVNEKNKKVVDDIQLYISQAGQVTELISEGTSPKRIKELLDKQVKLFSTFTDPSIRGDIMTGDPEKIGSALNRATEYANKRRTGLDLVSSVAREDEDVGITRKLAKNSWALNFALPGLGIGVGMWDKILAKTTGSGIYNRLGVGEISNKGKEAISTQLVDSLRDFSENDIKKFSEAIQNDGLKSLENFKDQLNLTSGEIEYIRQKSTDIEFKDIAKNAIEQRVKQLNIESSFGDQFRRGATRFQLSNLDWQRAGFAEQLKGIRVGISGESAIRKSSAIRTAGIELNPNLTEASRAGLLGEEQISNIQATNRLKMFGAIQNAKVSLTALPQQSGGAISTQEILEMKNLLETIANTGDITPLEKKIEQLEVSQNDILNETKDANSDDKQFQGLFLSSFRDQLKQLVEIKESNKAALEEAILTNALNQVRAKEVQRQNLLNSSNYSVDTFSQLRRNREAAQGLPFTKGPYKEGLTVQSKINEQDYLTGLGFANTDNSMAYLQEQKRARAKAMIATTLSQETGTKISAYDTQGMLSAIDKSTKMSDINKERARETVQLTGYDYNKEIRELASGGNNYQEIIDKIMKSGGDPTQGVIAANTGNIASTSSEINTNVIDGFSRIENLWSMALTENTVFGKYKEAMSEKSNVYTQLENAQDEREKLVKKGESTSSVDITIKDLEEKLKVANDKVDKILNQKTTVSAVGASGSIVGGVQNIKPLADRAEGELIVNDPLAVEGRNEQKDAVDSVTESLKGLKQGLIDSNTKWGTFAQLGEETGKRLSSAAGEGFGAFVTGAMRSKDEFRSFASSVIADIAKMYAQKAMSGIISGLMGGTFANTGGAIFANTGGSILKFATGGKVPALLTGGEYYFSPSAAKSIGQNNLNAINSGTARFAGGGLVRGGSGYMDDVPAMLDSGGFVVKRSAVQKYGSSNLGLLARNTGGEVSMYAAGGSVSPSKMMGNLFPNSNNGGNTNVKIELHDNRTSASASSDQSVNDPEFNRRLSMAIKTTVLETVNEQRRIGGALRQQRNY